MRLVDPAPHNRTNLLVDHQDKVHHLWLSSGSAPRKHHSAELGLGLWLWLGLWLGLWLWLWLGLGLGLGKQ